MYTNEFPNRKAHTPTYYYTCIRRKKMHCDLCHKDNQNCLSHSNHKITYIFNFIHNKLKRNGIKNNNEK